MIMIINYNKKLSSTSNYQSYYYETFLYMKQVPLKLKTDCFCNFVLKFILGTTFSFINLSKSKDKNLKNSFTQKTYVKF